MKKKCGVSRAEHFDSTLTISAKTPLVVVLVLIFQTENQGPLWGLGKL